MSESKFVGADERVRKSAGAQVRGDRADEDNSRTMSDGTAMTLEERRRMLRSEWDQNVLPEPPKEAGWHYCWLSTTNSADPIYKRVQRGYEPVKAADVPGFAQYKATQGEFEGCVACNEMLLFRIRDELYQDIMSYFHYEKPLEEEEILSANSQINDRDSNGRALGEREGFDSLGKRVKQPTY